MSKRPVIRLFASAHDARAAILSLETAGVSPQSISVMARSPKDAEVLEDATGASEDLEDAAYRTRLRAFADWLSRVGSAAFPAFGPVLGTGDLWQDVAIGGRGPGSITGALVGVGVSVNEAAQLERAVFGGKILVVVHGAQDSDRIEGLINGTS